VELRDKLAEQGITIQPIFNHPQGKQRDGAQWLIAKEFDIGGKLVQLVWAGNFKTGAKLEWKSDNASELKGDEKKQMDAAIEAILAGERLEREAFWLEVKERAEKLWNEATDRGTHPYLQKKKIESLHGGRVWINPENNHPVLLIPMRDSEGVLWNVTRIYSKKFEGTGADKFILKGGKKQGLFHLLGEIREASTIYFCEGWATGASVHEAMGGAPTVICFDAGNLEPVALVLREKYPNASFVFAADNDLFTKRSNGSPWNPGREKALAAASATKGTVILPRFPQALLDSAKPTDFDDLRFHLGRKEVEEQLSNPAKVIQEVVPLAKEGKGAKAKVSEKAICASLLEYFDGKLVKSKSDLFSYRNNYWHLLDENGRDAVKRLIAALAPDYGSRDIDGAFRYFMLHAPTPPPGVNLFQPSPFAANFENGTLHVRREGGRYSAEFKAHSPHDWLTSKLPFDFPGIPGTPEYRKAVNPEFESMLRRVWQGDNDIDDKIRLYKQVLGACLIPLFPTIVLFQGRPGTGKSTLLKLLRHLVSPENISTVDPADFQGFLMESMIGKLLNINTDIDLVKPMKDSMVKKIIDRVPIQINRKNEKVVHAFLPAVHAFAANNLPRTLDGESRAYERRMVIVKTEKFQPSGNYDKEFDLHVWEAGPEGVICAAVEGLFDLLESNGHYHNLESGKVLVREMQDRNDPIAQFLKDVDAGDVRDGNVLVERGPNCRITRQNLWACFKTWRDEQDRYTQGVGKHQLFRQLEAKGYEIVTVHGVRCFKGIGSAESEGAKF